MRRFTISHYSPYLLDVDAVESPRLVIFEDRVEKNIQTMQRLLHTANPELSLAALCPHVKTTKSTWAVERLIEHGITFFKATPNELDMLLQTRAQSIFVAYPLLEHTARTLAKRIVRHPNRIIYVQASHTQHLEILRTVAREFSIQWNLFIDINVGMNRTGLKAESALDFYKIFANDVDFQFAGLHAYDGHAHQISQTERRRVVEQSMARLDAALNQFARFDVKVPCTMVAGTPGFLLDAEYFRGMNHQTTLFLSPGTWLYFDAVSETMLPATFEPAALIYAQVMDRPTLETATLNVGHKRWSVDQGPVTLFSRPRMQAKSWSEEHTVVTVPPDKTINIGDPLLIVPQHVCSTVNLWETAVRVDERGDIVDFRMKIDARNR